jgi:hypothetical protein
MLAKRRGIGEPLEPRRRESNRRPAGASPAFFNGRREQIVALAEHHAIPAIYEWREFAEAGGLMSYGTNLVEAYRLQGVYAGARSPWTCRWCSSLNST